MMRNSQVYISGRTKHRLHLLANVTASQDVSMLEEKKHATADELADSIINEWLALNFPEITSLEMQIAELETRCAESIRKRKEEKP